MRDRSRDLVIHVVCNKDGMYTARELMHGVWVGSLEASREAAVDALLIAMAGEGHEGARASDSAFIDCVATLDERRFSR